MVVVVVAVPRCIERPSVPSETVLGMLTALRDSLLRAAEEATGTRERKADELCGQRTDFLTEELEEKLRMHWPRKGRTEVGGQAGREGPAEPCRAAVTPPRRPCACLPAGELQGPKGGRADRAPQQGRAPRAHPGRPQRLARGRLRRRPLGRAGALPGLLAAGAGLHGLAAAAGLDRRLPGRDGSWGVPGSGKSVLYSTSLQAAV